MQKDYRNSPFSGKAVWLTGASSGIGEALAKEFAAAGAKVILSARNETELGRVAKDCGSNAAVLPMDVGEHAALPSHAKRAAEFFGPVDVLVNNAGVGQRGAALETKLEVVKSIFDVNFFPYVELSRAVLPSMMGRGSGLIVAVSSVLGLLPLPRRAAYCASKHAIEGYFETLRLELAGSGVRVAVVRPGWIETKISENAVSADGAKHGQPSARAGKRMSSGDCARRVLEGLSKGRDEILVGGPETWGVLAKRLLPSRLFRWGYAKFRL